MLSAIDPERILIVRPSALGDVCRSVPVATSLKQRWPSSRIDWLVQDGFQDAIEAHPAVERCVLFGRKRLARWWYHPGTTLELYRFLRSLRRQKYDLVIDCQGLGRSGLFTWVTRARVRVGSRQAREAGWLGYNKRADTARFTHAVDRMLAVLDEIHVPVIPDLRLYVNDDHKQWWQQYRGDLGIGADPYVVLAPTSRWPSKRWAKDRWAQLANALSQGNGAEAPLHVVIIGAPGEQDQIDGLIGGATASARLHDCCGKFSVGQTMAAIAGARLVVANDSAPLHMAVGFARPIVALFGPTDPAKVGPYGHLESVLQHVDHDALAKVNYRLDQPGSAWMDRITVEEVIEASRLALAQQQSQASIQGPGQ